MSKHILKISDNKYETNRFCPICECIDRLFKTVSTQKDIETLEGLLVNGYNLPDVLEANNMTSKYNILKSIPSYHDDIYNKALSQIGNQQMIYNSYNAMSPTLLFGRWCKNCGSRKHDIYDTTFKADYTSCVNFDLNTMTLTWDDIQFDFDHSYRISRINDKHEEVYLTTTKNLSYTDNLEDGRLYLYKIEVLDELNTPVHILQKYVFVPALNHTPETVDIQYRVHRTLIDDSGKLTPYDYIYASYDSSDDDLGNVIIKVNDDHIPSKTFWIHDLYFKDNRFDFFDDKTYFVKPYFISKRFKQQGENDHLYYPDLYFWNTNLAPAMIKRENWYKDYIYNLTFTPDDYQMTITFSVDLSNPIKQFHLYFKQGEEIITDQNNSFKHIIFKPKKGIEDYIITINNLASNSKWSFALFPEYEQYDEDIREEYQNTSMITPIHDSDKYFTNPSDFHDINHWKLGKDFSLYENYQKVYSKENRGMVWLCEQLDYHDVGVLLIHDTKIPEFFTLSYDYKFLNKNSDDVFNMFYNFNLEQRLGTRNNYWHHFEKLYENQRNYIIRWEVMRHAHSKQTCAFLDNIHIKFHNIIDNYLDNFTYQEDIKLKDMFYYNKKFRHNGKYRHSPKRYYSMTVDMNPYTEQDIQD